MIISQCLRIGKFFASFLSCSIWFIKRQFWRGTIWNFNTFNSLYKGSVQSKCFLKVIFHTALFWSISICFWFFVIVGPIINFGTKQIMINHFQGIITCYILQLLALPSLAASLKPFRHRNVASLSLFYRYYFGRSSSELGQLVPLPFSQGRSTCYSDRFHDFSFTIPRYFKDIYVDSFFPQTARLWNSLPIECFP